MNRLSRAVAAAVATLAFAIPAVASADGTEHAKGSLGFHNSSAPVGGRWWLSGQKVAIDLGLGVSSSPSGVDPDEKVLGWSIDAGVPFVLKSWDKVHFLLRPGLLYSSQEVAALVGTPPVYDTDNSTNLSISGEFEAEVFLADNFSVSASHGIAFDSFSPAGGGDSQTSFNTIAGSFTNIGFHVYIFGAE